MSSAKATSVLCSSPTEITSYFSLEAVNFNDQLVLETFGSVFQSNSDADEVWSPDFRLELRSKKMNSEGKNCQKIFSSFKNTTKQIKLEFRLKAFESDTNVWSADKERKKEET